MRTLTDIDTATINNLMCKYGCDVMILGIADLIEDAFPDADKLAKHNTRVMRDAVAALARSHEELQVKKRGLWSRFINRNRVYEGECSHNS